MPERPLVLFPLHEKAEKTRRFGGPQSFHKPTHERQVERLTPQFEALQHALDEGRIKFRQGATSVEPEYTLVFEVAGDPNGFSTAIRNLQKDNQGVEWLFELINDEEENDEDFYRIRKSGDIDIEKSMSYKYFCILTNQRALTEILSIWDYFSHNKDYKFPNGKTGLRNVFQTLRDIHRWGPVERFEETGVLDAWKVDLQDSHLLNVRCEIELFYRRASEKRSEALQQVIDTIHNMGGDVKTQSCIDEIKYQAILASIPRQCAEDILIDNNVSSMNIDQIMFVKPVGQSIVSSSNESIDFSGQVNIPEDIKDEPIIALFDGLPQENHPLLRNLIVVDDPDNYSSAYQLKDRIHGTSMASLIAHGNLEGYSKTVTRKIYVRPIMRPYFISSTETDEFFPNDSLIVDQIHKAVRRLFEPEAGRVSPTIKIINLSIGIGDRLFYNFISPLARLLDWLSFKYRILFIVSAGNHNLNSLDLGMPFLNFCSLSNGEKVEQIINILNRDARGLRLLSPAESMNSLTVGATFQDESHFNPIPNQILPCENGEVSPISSMGCGINRSIKPDILYNGGKNVLLEDVQHHNNGYWRKSGNYPPGILSAKPYSITGSSSPVGYSFGTSDATACMTHNAAICFDILNDIFIGELGSEIPDEYVALLIKAMLVHGAKWGKTANEIRSALSLPGRAADQVHRWLGYGYPDISRVMECTKNRITLIGYGDLFMDEAHVFKLPLPFNFHLGRIYRCLTVTLASFTPIKPDTQKYRLSQLWFTINDSKKIFPNRIDASDKAAARGTIQHERFEGEQIVVWDENDSILIQVNCRSDAGIFSESIPYALFCTFEVAPEIDIDVYQRVIERIKVREAINP